MMMAKTTKMRKDNGEPVRKPHYHMKPTEESKEKLSKLQPLPPLLEEFDLDSHVGLIQKLLKEDPTLVKMQATLSGNVLCVFCWRDFVCHYYEVFV